LKFKNWAVDSMPLGTFVEVTTDIKEDGWRYVERGHFAGHDEHGRMILESEAVSGWTRRIVVQQAWVLDWRVIR
jgi:hypothetical protein